eukprot:c18090_g2_i1 orf=470-739(+)
MGTQLMESMLRSSNILKAGNFEEVHASSRYFSKVVAMHASSHASPPPILLSKMAPPASPRASLVDPITLCSQAQLPHNGRSDNGFFATA